MNTEATFRTVMIVALLTIMSVGIYYRLKSRTSEALDRRQEGLFILITLRFAGLVVWLAIIAYMINPPSMAWGSMSLPVWLRWTGASLFIVVFALLTWTLHDLGGNLTDTVVTRQSHTLVTHGPYRFVRHPFYVSVALLILACSLVAANWFFLLTGSVVMSLLIARTRAEEERLLSRFGNPYRAYVMRTGRFVPKLRAIRK